MVSPSGRRVGLWLGAAALVAIAYALWPTSSDRRTGAGAGASASGPTGSTTFAAGASPTAPAAPSTALAAAPGSPEFIRRIIDDYKAATVYPPWSRIHDESTKHLVEWNKPVVSELPFSDKPGAETQYHFASDRAHVMFGEALTSWIEVWEKGDPNKRVPIRVVTAWVMLTSGGKPGRAVQLTYRDDGTDGDAVSGDRRYSNRFVPSAFKELTEPALARIEAEVEVDGVHKLMVRDFTYAPRQVLTVVGVSDALAEGSLLLNVEVDAHEPGAYSVEANVYDASGNTPIASGTVTQTLAAGKAVVPLKFFGKAFHDVGVDGPYVVKDFRGFLLSPGAQANVWWSDSRTHVTQAHKRTDFSSAEWDSPEKRARIGNLEALAKQAGSGAPAPSASQPKAIHIDDKGVAHVVE
ncbi:MAG: hypothetical protein HYV09_39170 [Deltaproteobacteria bacterium]|nr:hypothetical protein [Deltaproteobacteria bacterium]